LVNWPTTSSSSSGGRGAARRVGRATYTAVFTVSLLAVAWPATACVTPAKPSGLASATVERVNDGDTLLLRLADEGCVVADVVVDIAWSDRLDWHPLAHGRLQVQDDGRVRQYRIQVVGHDFSFAVIRMPDGGTAGNGPPSLIQTLIPHSVAQDSVGISANGEIHERAGDLELRVRRVGCIQSAG
jgi:hypothetical protein